jgi:hypothetical protein
MGDSGSEDGQEPMAGLLWGNLGEDVDYLDKVSLCVRPCACAQHADPAPGVRATQPAAADAADGRSCMCV